jgi:uncharacterized membrane protein
VSRYLLDWKVLFYNLALILNGLLVFLLVFEESFILPFWLQALGRTHPLVLHFPLVVLILYSFWVIIIRKPGSSQWNEGIGDSLLIIGTLTGVIAAFSGLVLSKEDSYESDALVWHKFLGVAISIISLVWYSFRKYLEPWKLGTKILAFSFIVLLFVGGHLGGNLTHGGDFLISPLGPSVSEVSSVAFEEVNVYEHLVKPVLEQKCLSCHNDKKAKGGLQMQTQSLFIKGGNEGALWDTTRADLGLLISRIHLPVEDKKHMPPRGKVQLTEEEIVLLAAWVRGGSLFDQKVSALSPQNPMYTYAQNILGSDGNEAQYEFSAADADEVKKLNTTYRLIKPMSAESPALFVNFYNRSIFTSQDIEGLMPLRGQIVSMDLSKMPVKDQDLKTLAGFPELRKLILNFTDITGGTLSELKKLKNLRELSLSGTVLHIKHVQELETFPSLKKVYIWNTGLSTEELVALKKAKRINFETGFRSDTLILALNEPIIVTEQQLIAKHERVTLKHQIAGTVIRYTLDGSKPDSATSLVYESPIAITQNSTLKARAFRDGWYGSKQVSKVFFKAGSPVDSAQLRSPADPSYKGNGAKSLSDGKVGDTDRGSGTWLGFNQNDFQGYLYLKKPVQTGSVTISMLRNIGSHIFPPTRIEVWGGVNDKSLKLLKVIIPEMPTKDIPGAENLVYEAVFEPQQLSCIKVMAKPLSKLPNWHASKGKKGWLFIDEVIVN